MLNKKQIKAIEELTDTTCLFGIQEDLDGHIATFTGDVNNFKIFKDENQFSIVETYYIEVKWLATLAKILEEK